MILQLTILAIAVAIFYFYRQNHVGAGGAAPVGMGGGNTRSASNGTTTKSQTTTGSKAPKTSDSASGIMPSVPPGDITTQPDTKIVFNGPYNDQHTYHTKITNTSARRIGWAIKTNNMKRLSTDPTSGVLDPKETVIMAVSCDAFAYGEENSTNDRITIEWANTPEGASKQFRREWFQRDGMVRRKNLPIEYNP